MIHGKYIEVKPVIQKFLPKGIHVFYFCAGRGLGKTYSSLDLCRELSTGQFLLDDSREVNKFLYLRRSAVEAQSVARPESCPFKRYNSNEGYTINADFIQSIGYGNFYMDEDQTQHLGYCAALSTFSNLRGVDFSDVDLILYDECIPENKNKRPLDNEGYLFLDMLETINRNRALEGKPEVVVILLSNPIDLGSPFLSQLQITPILNSMIFKSQQRYTDYNRSLHIEKFVDHPVSKEKEEKSFLYKFAKNTGYNDRSLSGNFVQNDLTMIKKVSLNEYKPFCTVENVCIYEHKSNGEYYASQNVTPAKYVFRAFEKEKIRTAIYWKYKTLMITRNIYFDSFATKVVLEEMIGYKPLS